ncbi:MAG: LptF/LptG family permease [Desulfovibrio sp.]|nr:LptF/LptG family permease [Desulfovibrio sp.]
MTTLLFRYVFSRHARLLLITLSVGLGVYLLTELVERADTFLETKSGPWLMLRYFGARLPSILARILPSVFLLASVITLCLMAHNREDVALQTGGVSPGVVTAALILSGLFWGGVQFACSQWLGTAGDRYAERVWNGQVRKRAELPQVLSNVWFTEGEWIVSLDALSRNGSGTGLAAYRLSADGLSVESIVHAPEFTAGTDGWTARGASRVVPSLFLREAPADLVLPLTHDPGVFFLGGQDNPQMLPMWLLTEAIAQLSAAGSNVEGLITAWHAKLANAASLAVMAVLAAAIAAWWRNVYIAVGFSVAATFLFYAFSLFGESTGQRGFLPPMAAAWGTNAAFLLLAFLAIRLSRAK